MTDRELETMLNEEFGERVAVVLPYQTPAERALGTLYRALVLDVLGVAVATIASVPLDGPVPWRAIGLGAAVLLGKTLATTLLKYDRAMREDTPYPGDPA